SGKHPLEHFTLTDGGPLTVTASAVTPEHPVSVQSDLTWLPVEDGSTVAPAAAGFVVTRETDMLDKGGGPPTRIALDHPAVEVKLAVGDVVEDTVELVNPAERNHVAIVVPFAAGMEPLNPTLATAPPEATPSAPPTLEPSYTALLDDRVEYFYDTLPKGTFVFRVRTKAAVPGRFIQPAAEARLMYEDAVNGHGAGAMIAIERPAAPE
ncbi:MAG TPA: alpha-2-macroglobulin, partial [Stellaceae bacterium]|nr:alpha-2-macroglobulin [Stellaceae bacterium]